jgi:hypothetical protein
MAASLKKAGKRVAGPWHLIGYCRILQRPLPRLWPRLPLPFGIEFPQWIKMSRRNDTSRKPIVAMQHYRMASIARGAPRRPESCMQVEEPSKRAR